MSSAEIINQHAQRLECKAAVPASVECTCIEYRASGASGALFQ